MRMGKKNKTPEHALQTVAKLAARKAPAVRLYRAMRAYYKANGQEVPDDLTSMITRDGVAM
jgi:hypothetical protein